MKSDDVLSVLGDFGTYQKFVFVALCLPTALIAMQYMSPIFILATPNHRYDFTYINLIYVGFKYQQIFKIIFLNMQENCA